MQKSSQVTLHKRMQMRWQEDETQMGGLDEAERLFVDGRDIGVLGDISVIAGNRRRMCERLPIERSGGLKSRKNETSFLV